MDSKEINQIALSNLPEIANISMPDIQEFTKGSVLAAPGQFWLKASAYYRGHHPDDEIAEWGNLRHTKRTLVVAEILATIEALDGLEHDCLISGLVIHDMGKYGVFGDAMKIIFNHPVLVASIVKDIPLDHGNKTAILKIVASHMGRWGDVPPQTKAEILAHYADCIASRTSLNIPVSIKV